MATVTYMRWRRPQRKPQSCCMMSCTRRNNRRKIRWGGGGGARGHKLGYHSIWVCDDGHGLGEPSSCQQKDFPWPIHHLLLFARPQLFNVVIMGGTDRDGIRSGEGWGGWIGEMVRIRGIEKQTL